MQDGEQLTNNPNSPEPENVGSEVTVAAPINRPKNHLWMWTTGLVLVALAIAGLIFFGLRNKAKDNQTSTTTIKPQQVDTSKLSPATEAFSVTNDKVVINGQLQADSALVLTPIAQPNTPVTGLVFLDSNGNDLRYYDGEQFVTVASTAQLASLQATINNATVGVTSVQGASGAITLVGGSGLAVNASGKTITLSLPQNLTTASSPTFNALTLSSLNCTGNQNGGVITTNSSGHLVCADDDATPPGAGITTLNGQVGTVQTFANDTNITISSAGDVHTLGWSGTLSVARGGTGSGTAAGARTNLGAAASGVNGDITSTTALNTITPSGALTVGSTSQTALLQGSTFTITSNGAGNDIVLTSADQIRFTGFNCTVFANGGVLTTDASGNISCANDDVGAATGDITSVNAGTGLTGGALSGDATLDVAYGSIAGTAVEGDTTLDCPSAGTNLSGGGTSITLGTGGTCAALAVVNNPTFSGLVTANGGLTFGASQTLTMNSDVINDFTGNGLQMSGNALTATLGTDVDLASAEVTGILGVTNGGTGAGTFTQYGILYGNGTNPIQVTAPGDTGDCLLGNTGGAPTWGPCPGGGGTGVTTIGGLNGGTANPDGATISGVTLFLQSADTSYAGLVDTTTQSFAGDKTFTDTLAVLGSSITVGEASTTDGSIILQNATNAFGVTISAPDQTVGSVNIKLPNTVGADDEICLFTLQNCLGGAGGGANTALSNLTAVAINTSLLTGAANIDLGSNTNPFRDLYLGGTATNNFQITGTATAAQVLTLPDETGKFCTNDTSSTSTDPLDLNYDTCYDKFASASNSGAYIQFAPNSEQVDSNVNPLSSTIKIAKDNTNGDIIHVRGWDGAALADAFVLKATGDTYFRSLTSSETAFQIQNVANEDVLNVSTVSVVNLISSPDSTFDTTDIINVNWVEVGNGSPGTSPDPVALYEDASYDSGNPNNSLDVQNNTAGGGVKYDFPLTSGEDYTLTLYARKLDTKATKIRAGYYSGSDLSSITYECTTNTGLSNANWTKVTCEFPNVPSGQAGIYVRGNTSNGHWIMDKVILQVGLDAKPLSTGLIELNTTTYTKLDSEHAFVIQAATSGKEVLDVDTLDGKVTLQSVNNVDHVFQVLNKDGDQIFNLNAGNAGSLDQWQASSNLPSNTRRQRFQAAKYKIGDTTYGYIIGGQSTGSSADSTVFYGKLQDNGTADWTDDATSALPANRFGGATVAAKGFIYYIDGCDETNTSMGNVWYSKINGNGSLTDPDPIGNPGTRWLTTSSLQDDPSTVGAGQNESTLCFAKALYYNGYIYVIGGGLGLSGASGSTNKVQVAKIESDGSLSGGWSFSNDLPEFRRSMGLAIGPSPTANSVRIYAMGGMGGPAIGSSSIQEEVYYADIDTTTPGSLGAWSTSANLLPDVRTDGEAAVDTVGGLSFLYYFGGADSGTGGQKNTAFTSTLDLSSSDSVGEFNSTTMIDGSGNYLYRKQFGLLLRDHIFYMLGGQKNGGQVQFSTYYVTSKGNASHADINGTLSVSSSIAAGGKLTVTTADDTAGALSINNSVGNTLLSVDTDTSNINIGGSDQAQLQTWEPASPLPTDRVGNGAVIVNGYIYSISGSSDGTVYYAKVNADGSTGDFTDTGVAALPASDYKDHAGVIAANGYIYAVGGYDSGSGASATNVIYYTKPNSDGTITSWREASGTVESSLTAVASPGISVYRGYLYIAGGATSSTAGVPDTPTDDVQYAKINPDGSLSNFTTSGNNLLAERMGGRLNAANGYLYFSGGANNNAGGKTAQDDVYYAQVASNGSVGSWTATTNISQNRAYHTSVIANGYLYILGGTVTTYSAAGSNNSDGIIYGKLNSDGTISSWSTNSDDTPLYAPTSGGATASANGYIYILGGTGPTNVVMYTSTQRVSVGGTLDLVGPNSNFLSDVGGAGLLTAGNTTIVGTLEVHDNAIFSQSVAIGENLSVGGQAVFQNSTDSTTAFQIQDSTGATLFNVDTTNGEIQANADMRFADVNTIYVNNIYQTVNGQNMIISAGDDGLTLHANGIDFNLPSTGGTSQDICTSGVSCASGGGVAVLLAPDDGGGPPAAEAQINSGSFPSIYINNTGGADLLKLQSGGDDVFNVNSDGELTLGTPNSGGTPRDGTISFNNASTNYKVILQSGATNNTSADLTLTLPTADGSAGDCLKTNGSGVLSFVACVGGGGGGGVVSVNSLTGTLNLLGTTNQISVSSGGSNITLSTPQNINNTATPTFGGLTINGTGTFTTSVLTPLLDANSAAALAIGTTNATVINLNQDTTVASAKTLKTNSLDATTATTLAIGTTVATGINLNANTTVLTNKSFTANGAALFQDATSSATAFQVQNTSNNTVLSVDTSANQVLFGKIGTLNAKVVLASSTAGGSITLAPDSSENIAETITVPLGGGTLCTTVNISTCLTGGGGAGTAFLQNGNSFGTTGTLGTNDGNSLAFETNNVTRLTVDTSGNFTIASLNTGGTHTLGVATSATANAAGDALTISAGTANGSTTGGVGGILTLQGGAAAGSGNNAGGNVVITAGSPTGTGNPGNVIITAATSTGNQNAVAGVTGAVNITGGTGFATNFGFGGAVTIQGGTAGTAGIGVATSGGQLTLQGGAAAGTVGSVGGSVSIAGAAGIGTGGGGAVTIAGGAGGSSTNGGTLTLSGGASSSGTGAPVNINGGANVGGVGGAITLTSGAGTASAGAITLQGGTSTASAGSAININAGNAGAGAFVGGAISLQAGTGGTSGTATGGAITITGGTGGTSSTGGAVTVKGGTGAGNNPGGLLTLQGGTAGPNAGATGGGVTLQASDGSAASGGGPGGAVTIAAGNGTGSGNRAGGAISITAGNSANAGAGGNITIQAGNAGIGGGAGTILIQAGTASSVSAGGTIQVLSGSSSSSATASGQATFGSGSGIQAGSGIVLVQSGAVLAANPTGTSGNVTVTSGTMSVSAGTGTSGNLSLQTGSVSDLSLGGALGTMTSGNITLSSGSITTTTAAHVGVTGDVNISTGGFSTTGNTTSGNVNISVGLANGTGTAGSINIGGSSNVASSINIGTVGSFTIASTIHIADTSDGTGTQSVTIGSTAKAANAVTIQGGTGATAIQLLQGSGGTIVVGGTTGAAAVSVKCGTGTCGLGNNATDHTTTVGSTTGTSALLLQSGSGNITFTGNLLPNAAGTYDLGSTSAEMNNIYLGDNNGLKLGLDQDATLAYDEATNDRVQLTGTNASLFLEDRLGLGVDARTINDNGVGASAATLTLNPSSSYVAITCNDADGCDITMSESTGVIDGNLVFIFNVSSNTVNFADTSGVSELSGGFAAGQYDSIHLMYVSDRWVEVSRSNN